TLGVLDLVPRPDEYVAVEEMLVAATMMHRPRPALREQRKNDRLAPRRAGEGEDRMKRIFHMMAGGLVLLAAPLAAQESGLTLGMQLEPPILDPTAGAAAAIDEVVYANVFEGLTRFGPDGSVLPGLAESWEIAPDGLSWAF